MSEAHEKRLAAWLKNRLQHLPRVYGLELGHHTGEEIDVLVTIERPEPKPEEAPPKLEVQAAEYAAELLQLADSTQEASGGRQRFEVFALSRDGKRTARYALTLGEGRSHSEATAPTERGAMQVVTRALADRERHLEKMYGLLPAAMEQLVRLTTAQGAQLSESEERRLKYVRLSEDMESRAWERKFEELKLAQGERQSDRWMAVVDKLAPDAAKQFTAYLGSKVGGILDSDVGKAQETLKKVWRVIDRRAVEGALDPERRTELDNLLGLATDAKTIEEYRNALRWVLAGLPPEIGAGLIDHLTKNHPIIGLEFERLVKGEEAKDEKKTEKKTEAPAAESVKDAAE